MSSATARRMFVTAFTSGASAVPPASCGGLISRRCRRMVDYRYPRPKTVTSSCINSALSAADSRELRFFAGVTSSQSSASETESSSVGSMSGKGSLAINLTHEESDLFNLLAQVVRESPDMSSTLRVAGGWVRDKLLATNEFRREFQDVGPYSADSDASGRNGDAGEVVRLTSKFLSKSRGLSMGRQGTKIIGAKNGALGISLLSESAPVDIDIAIDDMLGREFADHLNEWLTQHGRETYSVGVVLANPEKSKHLETATMKVGNFWIDFVNLRAEE